jgi:hypothetical protein
MARMQQRGESLAERVLFVTLKKRGVAQRQDNTEAKT